MFVIKAHFKLKIRPMQVIFKMEVAVFKTILIVFALVSVGDCTFKKMFMKSQGYGQACCAQQAVVVRTQPIVVQQPVVVRKQPVVVQQPVIVQRHPVAVQRPVQQCCAQPVVVQQPQTNGVCCQNGGGGGGFGFGFGFGGGYGNGK